MQTEVPGQESGEAGALRLHQHQEVQAHVLRRLYGQALLRPQQVAHDQGQLHLQRGHQHAVEDAVDNILRVPEEVQRSKRHVF